MHARPLSRPAATKLRLQEIVAHPALVSTLPEETLAPLLAAVAAQQAALSAVQGFLAARLLERSPSRADQYEPERLLTADQVAQSLGVTPRWVQRRARRLPFARQLSEHAIRYSESGLKRWMAHRRADVRESRSESGSP